MSSKGRMDDQEAGELQDRSTDSQSPPAKRTKSQRQNETSDLFKPLTRSNLKVLQDSIGSSQHNSCTRSHEGSVPYVPAHSWPRVIRSIRTASYASSQAHAPDDPRFGACLTECTYNEGPNIEKPHPEDIDKWTRIMARRRDSPEPYERLFHETRHIVRGKDPTSVIKR